MCLLEINDDKDDNNGTSITNKSLLKTNETLKSMSRADLKNAGDFEIPSVYILEFGSLRTHHRAELIAVDQHPALVAIGAQLTSHHLDRHADLDRVLAQVR